MIGIVKTELTLAYRRRGEWVNPLTFFLIVGAFFPLAIGPENALLQRIAPGVLWIAALLATLLSLDLMFRQDYDEGVIEQMELSAVPFYQQVSAKVFAHWAFSGAPLVVLSPLLATMLHLPSESLGLLMLTLLVGTAVLSLIGSVGAAITVALQRGGVVLALLILPLFIPVLIFGSSAVNASLFGESPWFELLMLSAMLIFAASLAPLAASMALRLNMRED